MEKFLVRYHSKITGILSTFDRMIFKRHILPLFQKSNRHYYLFQEKMLFRDFGTYAKRVSMGKGVFNLYRYAEVSKIVNERHCLLSYP